MKKSTENLVKGAIIAALYVALTFMSNIFGLAYGPVQFRFSEALCVLPVFSPAAIPGLCVGCFISNIASFNPLDMVFGTLGTLTGALLCYQFRKVKLFNLPVLSVVSNALINAVAIGAEITVLFAPAESEITLKAFFVSSLWILLGEAVTGIALGLLLYAAIEKNGKVLKFVDKN